MWVNEKCDVNTVSSPGKDDNGNNRACMQPLMMMLASASTQGDSIITLRNGQFASIMAIIIALK